MNEEKIKKIENKVNKRLERSLSSLHVFDEPRPDYVAKITVFDRFFAKTFLLFIPKKVRPNFLTVFRFVTIPFVIYFLLNGFYTSGLIIFAISAFSDALDGAMARTRKQITDWGIVFDPLADKLLIGSTAIIVISKLISPVLASFIIILEICMVVFAYFRFKGEIVPAKTSGKIKMILQSVGVAMLLLYLVVPASWILISATYVLYGAVVFALLSLFVYRSI